MDLERTFSRKLLGHAYRLELLAAIARAEEEGVVISDLAQQQGVSASVYYPPLKDLGQLGMIARVPESGSRRIRYIALSSPAWAGVTRLASDLTTPPSVEDGGI